MKKIFLIITIVAGVALGCCKECEFADPACSEVPPTEELCQAAFRTWFYDQEKNACKEKSYSGCAPRGFETKAACEACECN